MAESLHHLQPDSAGMSIGARHHHLHDLSLRRRLGYQMHPLRVRYFEVFWKSLAWQVHLRILVQFRHMVENINRSLVRPTLIGLLMTDNFRMANVLTDPFRGKNTL